MSLAPTLRIFGRKVEQNDGVTFSSSATIFPRYPAQELSEPINSPNCCRHLAGTRLSLRRNRAVFEGGKFQMI